LNEHLVIRSLKERKLIVMIREVLYRSTCSMPSPRRTISQSASNAFGFTRFRGFQLVKVVMRNASIAEGPHMTPKGLRPSFGIHAIRSAGPLNLVQRGLGHANNGDDRDLTGGLGRGRA
jgi:integrase/recombinase XerD